MNTTSSMRLTQSLIITTIRYTIILQLITMNTLFSELWISQTTTHTMDPLRRQLSMKSSHMLRDMKLNTTQSLTSMLIIRPSMRLITERTNTVKTITRYNSRMLTTTTDMEDTMTTM